MHTRISHVAMVLWYITMAGQIIVALFAWKRRHTGLAIFLAAQFLTEFVRYGFAKLTPWWTYYDAYRIGEVVAYVTEAFLALAIFSAIRKTGIPNPRHPQILQFVAMAIFAAATLTLSYPLDYAGAYPKWKWIFAVGHIANYWLCFMLVLAPAYAWLVDSAKDVRILLTYVAISLYVCVSAGAIDYAIASHLLKAKDVVHVPEFAYYLSLILWLFSCRYPSACHQWDPAKTESVKTALRSKYFINNDSSNLERSPSL